MKDKQFKAFVEISRFVPPYINQGTNVVEWSGTAIVHRDCATAPRRDGCALAPLKPVKFFWITYRGRRYPVDRDMHRPNTYTLLLTSTENPPTSNNLALDENRRRERLVRKLLRRGLVKANKTLPKRHP